MLCEYEPETLACRFCGHVAQRLPTYRACPVANISLPRVRLGSAVASFLRRFGITEDRVAQWLRVSDCGCGRRAELLNAWGFAQTEKAERVLNRAAAFYFGTAPSKLDQPRPPD